MPNVTMQRVAEVAGVSMKTVSRVVNKEPGVREETRERVLKVIEELEFQRNPAARGLAAARSFLIALLYDNPSTAYIIGLQTGALSTCRQHGYELLIHPCDHADKELIAHIRFMARQSRVDGLILTPPLCDMEPVLDMLDERGLKYVRISPLQHGDRSPVVFADEEQAAYRMTEYLVSQGHSRIGFITGHPNRSGTEMRLRGFRRGMADNGLEVDPELVIPGRYTFESGEAGARKLLRLKNRPTAIFASNDYTAAGVLKVANQMRIRVPYELSVCGYDDSPVSRHIWPPLTTIRHPVARMSEIATEILICHLKNQACNFDPESIQSHLVVRESTGPVPD
jgi:LacI family transcriptional regulator